MAFCLFIRSTHTHTSAYSVSICCTNNPSLDRMHKIHTFTFSSKCDVFNVHRITYSINEFLCYFICTKLTRNELWILQFFLPLPLSLPCSISFLSAGPAFGIDNIRLETMWHIYLHCLIPYTIVTTTTTTTPTPTTTSQTLKNLILNNAHCEHSGLGSYIFWIYLWSSRLSTNRFIIAP